jgi:hypothetical protein
MNFSEIAHQLYYSSVSHLSKLIQKATDLPRPI